MSSHQATSHALALLTQMLGPQSQFRAGQWQAIEAVVARGGRALVVQRTGWGKSLVYFLATKLLRDQGSGPTLLVSPLLSLMRNQIEAAVLVDDIIDDDLLESHARPERPEIAQGTLF